MRCQDKPTFPVTPIGGLFLLVSQGGKVKKTDASAWFFIRTEKYRLSRSGFKDLYSIRLEKNSKRWEKKKKVSQNIAQCWLNNNNIYR